MSGGIYLMQGDGDLVKMVEQPYDSEDRLQMLLAEHPDLLAGDRANDVDARRLLLVAREMGLPSEEGSTDRWSVDHLFLDQEAVPTIVEVKRSSDTRSRREVVAQMLDYAANAEAYWTLETLRSRFEASSEEPDQELVDFLQQPDTDPETFWQRVKTNLQAGRIRMIFAADEIPSELRHVVEFLNEQMDPAEVLAVEVKQYSGGGDSKMLISRLVGQTEEAQQKKVGATRIARRWNEPSFFEELERRCGSEEAEVAKRMLEWVKNNAFSIRWGTGGTDGSFTPTLEHGEIKHQVVGVYTNGSVEIKFEYMQDKPPFDERAKRTEFLGRLTDIPGISIPAEAVNGRRPSFRLSSLKEEAHLSQFLETLDWFVREARVAHPREE